MGGGDSVEVWLSVVMGVLAMFGYCDVFVFVFCFVWCRLLIVWCVCLS